MASRSAVEDLNDHDELRHDPLLAVLSGKLAARRRDCAPVAGKSTLNRLELSRSEPSRYHKIAYDAADRGAAGDAVPGGPQPAAGADHPRSRRHRRPAARHQEGRFFHGYYDCYCYLPLYVFCGRHLLATSCALRHRRHAGSVDEVARIVRQIRARWPFVRILLRADSGFAREALMAWCEQNRVDYLFGLARNARLVAMIEEELAVARAAAEKTGRPARRFKDFQWTTLDSWSQRRRVVAKAEWTHGEANPRFVVTSLKRSEAGARQLYEDIYCARGDMENRIKECQLDLYADRTSAQTMRANQLRLWFAAMAYVLVCALRRIALADTAFADATCGTIRLKFLKIGALVRISVRRIRVGDGLRMPGRR